MQPEATTTEIFLHIRMVVGMVLSLGIARLLTGVARFVQHPGRHPAYPVHLAWVASVLLMLVHFWWWEFWLLEIPRWTFGIYIFLIAYTILLFLLCTLLFPDTIDDYASYEAFFISRRKWFFGILALVTAVDLVDTLLKGQQHFERYGVEYAIRVPVYVGLCLAAMATQDRRFHVAFVIGSLAYQVSWIFRLFYTLS